MINPNPLPLNPWPIIWASTLFSDSLHHPVHVMETLFLRWMFFATNQKTNQKQCTKCWQYLQWVDGIGCSYSSHVTLERRYAFSFVSSSFRCYHWNPANSLSCKSAFTPGFKPRLPRTCLVRPGMWTPVGRRRCIRNACGWGMRQLDAWFEALLLYYILPRAWFSLTDWFS